MPRLEFSAKTKVLAYERSEGKCENVKCNATLRPNQIEYDHQIPAALGGDNSLANAVVLCRTCHKAKTTKQDVPRIAKAKRQYRGAINAKRISRNPMPGSKRSKFRKRMDGTVERRG